MKDDNNIEMSWNENNDLSLVISSIKTPLWKEGQENFENKCLIREFLQKCSGGKIVEMLKKILCGKEKSDLVKIELETFFQMQAQSFENHMNMKSEIISPKVEVKKEPIDQTENFDTLSENQAKVHNNLVLATETDFSIDNSNTEYVYMIDVEISEPENP